MPKKVKKFWSFKNLDEKTGELTLYGDIANETWWGDEVTPKTFKADLDGLGDMDTLNIYINSPGGDVFAGQAIHSMLKRHPAHKNVYIDGLAASIASVIAMAGDTIFMPKNAMMMIHHPWTFGIGNAAEFRKLADDLDKIGESLIAAYERRSALIKDEIVELMNEETWLTADECKEYGFCDVVEEEKQLAASMDKTLLTRYKNTPKEFLTKSKPNDKEHQLLKEKIAIELEL
ncbi:Clp protease ClpP [Alkalihalobacillus oceani]|uniref:head maturation protease, ClpP-related n=1 Tax=Halalkalibacter oceani TaxID=1653776 RepID=UPI00203D3B12|nr:head maturation protease, ClpP-related [Halalkalibacter oceani]MCM3761041.1 Clp protease ClpP [Halalkalibacter oceani]